MSIIQEALKKAQDAKPAELAEPVERNDAIFAKAPSAKGAGSPMPFILIFIILLCALIVFSGFAVKYFSRVPPVAKAAKAVEPVNTVKLPEPPPKPDPVVPQVIPEEPAPPAPVLILSGIMHPKSGPRALINNMTVSEGEFVEGAKVVAISDDRVILKRKDSEITLRLQ